MTAAYSQVEIDELVSLGIATDARRIKLLEMLLSESLIWLEHPEVVAATERCVGSPTNLAAFIRRELGATKTTQPPLDFLSINKASA